ncbi:MAG: hypothetical protein ACRYG8_24730 [Janthinobacterium lividum]
MTRNLPAGSAGTVGRVTGDGECNDYALVRRPGAAPLVMAVYYDAPGVKTEAQEAVLREVGLAIVAWAG